MSQLIGINVTMEELSASITRAVAEGVASGAVQPDRRKRLLSPRDVEAEFGLKPKVLENWRVTGVGPEYTTLGRRVYYERDRLEAFIAAGRVRTSSELLG